jgi:hypothetical protein
MATVTHEFVVCTDCQFGIEGMTEEELGRPLPADFGKFLPAEGHTVNTVGHECPFPEDCENQAVDFSDTACGSCGTTDAGDRYAAVTLSA